jgi:serine/threonine-protein kinase
VVAQGDVLSGRYRLVSAVAAGGMGTVYVADDERLGRQVALKLLKDSLAGDARFAERFKREARAAAALSHPNVANVYDYGVDDDCHYIVMELAPGRDLAQVLREEGPLEPRRAAALAAQIATALGHAHSAGLIHRDVKPANALIDDRDHVKVTDFGIARAAGESTLTATGTILGTAAYLSPEQAQGTKVDPRSDIYSLGIVMFEMLTGEVPFPGDSAVSVAMKHIAEDVPAPSSVRPGVPDELDEIVLRATARAPGDRFSDGTAMAEALRKIAEGPVGTRLGGDTAVLPPEDARILPVPTGPWDPERLGRAVLVAFAGLLVVAALLVGWRLTQGDDPAGASEGRSGRATEEPVEPSGSTVTEEEPEEPSEEPTTFVIQEELIGADAKSAKKQFEAEGFTVEEVKVEHDAPKGTVIGVDPDIGSEVVPGENTITLYVSDGKGEPDGRGPDGEGPPGHDDDDD